VNVLRDRETHIGDIVVEITVDNSVRKIALVVTEAGLIVIGIRLVDAVEAITVEFVIRHADEVALEYGHEWAVVVVDVVMAVGPSTVSPCPVRRRVVVDADLTIPALPILGAPTLRSGRISW
jgi:hypothetical protein